MDSVTRPAKRAATPARRPAPGQAGLPADYPQLLTDLKRRIAAAQTKARHAVNTELLRLYWAIGQAILTRQDTEGWGTKVIDHLAADLRAAFPAMKGLSRSNLHYMRQFAEAWPDPGVVPQPVGQLPWGHVRLLLDRVPDQADRDWYAAQAAQHGWSRAVLTDRITGQLRQRTGAAPSNFPATLPPDDSDMAQQLTRDPLIFEFLDLSGQVAERDLEQALMDRLTQTLLELGHGLAFVGRQYHLDVDGDDFYIDLLFFHVEQFRYVVVELKVGKFEPEFVGKLGFYVAVVDDQLRSDHHAPTVGLLLCADRNESVVRYSLGTSTSPMAVAGYTYEALPADEQAALPSAADLTAALDQPVDVAGRQLTLAEYIAELEHARARQEPTHDLPDEQSSQAR